MTFVDNFAHFPCEFHRTVGELAFIETELTDFKLKNFGSPVVSCELSNCVENFFIELESCSFDGFQISLYSQSTFLEGKFRQYLAAMLMCVMKGSHDLPNSPSRSLRKCGRILFFMLSSAQPINQSLTQFSSK